MKKRTLDNGIIENYTELLSGHCNGCGENVVKVVGSNLDIMKNGARYHYPEATDSWNIFRCRTCLAPMHKNWIEKVIIKQQKYLRLLSYDNACKVIDFINNNDKEDYVNITPEGVSMQFKESNWNAIETFIKSLNVRYEIGDTAPHKVVRQIIDNLKSKDII